MDETEKKDLEQLKEMNSQFQEQLQKREEAIAEIKKLEKSKYNGIAGILPPWIPENIQLEFKAARINLFLYSPPNVSYPLILRWFQEFEHMENRRGPAGYPSKFQQPFDTLFRIKKMVELGPEKGLSLVVGDEINKDAIRGKKSRINSKKGTETAHGTEKEKKEDRLEYQKAIEKLHAKQPHLSHHKLCKTVAPEFEKSPRTIYRHTQNPKKK